ncbi:MAG TPA: hypothetical protein VG253_24750 [Streptosporangiaceae bacterium]|jgi:hypothetical protein|nr:hypothetical protein [Streptosporangiaceae bacterium]
MTQLPEDVLAAIAGLPAAGELDQVFVLLTADPDGPIDVCLLSRTELQATPTTVLLVTRSTKARRNLAASGRATLIAMTGGAAHYIALEIRRTIEDEGALAAELAPVRVLRDDLGVELQPARFRAEERLRVEERWDRTTALLSRLADEAAQTAGGPA